MDLAHQVLDQRERSPHKPGLAVTLLSLPSLLKSLYPEHEPDAAQVLAYAAVMDALFQNNSTSIAARKAFHKDSIEILQSETTRSSYKLFAQLMLSECLHTKDLSLPLDIMGDTKEAFMSLCDTTHSDPEFLKNCVQLVEECLSVNVRADSLFNSYAQLYRDSNVFITSPAVRAYIKEELPKALIEIRTLPQPHTVLFEVDHLFQDGATPESVSLFLKLLPLLRGEIHTKLQSIRPHIQRLSKHANAAHLTKQLSQGLSEGVFSSLAEVIQVLDKAFRQEDMKLRKSGVTRPVTRPSRHYYYVGQQALGFRSTLEPMALHDTVQREPDRRVLQVRERVDDIAHGFTSLLYPARRFPDRETPDLVQFGVDLGSASSVSYLNAKDFDRFPGKGFYIKQLDLRKMLAL
ncbi:MAG: hypothetical protein KDD62_13965, partial [Bdellovibrionales bacterium]|nr:hypothetical protein [Bdellovibrionales bacterium]